MTTPAVLGVIVARGGSKGLPGKNLRPLGGKPLVVHTIEAALGCDALARAVLSTEDAAILEAGRRAGCPVPFVRPAELAGERSSTVDVALHAVDWLGRHEGFAADIVVLLPVTAPLRRAEHIRGALGVLRDDPAAEAVVAVTDPDYPPYWMLSVESRRLSWLFPEGAAVDHRQDLPRAYRPNGSIYAIHVPALRAQRTFYPRATAPYVMPREASVNIDTDVDFGLAELLLARRASG
ncbi:MAG TPA: acylneuraminate cytidylyltransferase family protein [Candidatus Limnocylindria bacterium]|nr:acylneuraminate cytidylyltransferase family protein [Candidatus Limnocylindria bacterium]